MAQSAAQADWFDEAGDYIPETVIAAFRAHPRFGEAMRQSCAGAVELYATDPLMFRALRDQAKFVCGIWALLLHYTPGGLTLTRLRDLCTEAGMCSPGTAYAMLIQLKLIGYVEMIGSSGDGRVRTYLPTARMLSAFRKRLGQEVEAVALIDGSVAPALAHWDDDAVFGAFMVTLGQGIVASAKVHRVREGGSLTLFSSRAGGMAIVYNLMMTGDPDDAFPPAKVRFSLAELARRCRLSRTHILRTIRSAEATGFLTRGAREGESELSPAMREDISLFYAIFFLGLAASARRAAAAIPEAPAERRVA